MRRKKHKHTRRSMAFYRLHYGFKEPFKVLVDGNFLHATLAANLTNLQGLLENLLGGACKLFTCRCVGDELRALGPDFAAAAAAARAHTALHRCGTDPPAAAASDCIAAQVGAANSGRWVVATQDRGLQAALARVPGSPLVFASANGIHLNDPSAAERARAADGARAAQSLPLHELASGALRDLPALQARAGGGGGAKFRRKRTKGPNPLSVKKKKATATKAAGAGAAAAVAAAPAKRKSSGGSGDAGGSAGAGSAGPADGGGSKRKRKRKKNASAGGGPESAAAS